MNRMVKVPLGNHDLITALLSHAQREIELLGLGDGQDSPQTVTVSESESGIVLSDGLSLYAVCETVTEVNRVLREYRQGLDDFC